MIRWKRVVSRLAGVAGAGLIIAACSEGSAAPTDPASPPIPSFAFSKVCKYWSCESGRCGYDTAYPPGACCVEWGTGTAAPKPSCRFP
jgi:hypothetical protein